MKKDETIDFLEAGGFDKIKKEINEKSKLEFNITNLKFDFFSFGITLYDEKFIFSYLKGIVQENENESENLKTYKNTFSKLDFECFEWYEFKLSVNIFKMIHVLTELIISQGKKQEQRLSQNIYQPMQIF